MNFISFKYYVPSITWAFFILVICLLPQKHLPTPHFYHEDWVVHFVTYLILGVLILFAWYKTKREFDIRKVISGWAMISLFGLCIEILQAVLPINRTFSLEDFSINSLGAAILFFQIKLNDLFLRWNL